MSERQLLEPGLILHGRYEISDLIGRGNMGEVYRSRDLNLDRDVAIKIHPVSQSYLTQNGMSAEEFVERFNREKSILVRINHTNVVLIYDANWFKGSPYLVMEYIDGESLEDKMVDEETNLDTSQILEIGSDVSSALVYMHDRGIVHRDVKPSNILIDSKGRVYLSDFGIAKSNKDSGDITQIYNPDYMHGSMMYFSPEYATGESEGPKTEQYALGVTLLSVLHGDDFHFDFTNRFQFLHALIHGHITYPTPSSLREDFSPSDDHVIMKLVQRDPEHRYSSTKAMHDALHSLAGKYKSVRPQPVTQRPPLQSA